MTSKRLMLFLLTLFLFSHTNSSSASVDLQDEKLKNNGMDLYDGNNGIARRITRSSGGGSGSGSGRRSGSGSGGGGSGTGVGSENGGSGSTSPRTPGGAAVIPAYGAGGAANINKGHHSSGNRLHGSMGVISALSATILLSLFTVYLV